MNNIIQYCTQEMDKNQHAHAVLVRQLSVLDKSDAEKTLPIYQSILQDMRTIVENMQLYTAVAQFIEQDLDDYVKKHFKEPSAVPDLPKPQSKKKGTANAK